MDINVGPLDGAWLLVVTGDLDLSNVSEFIERLFELSVDGDRKIVLDLTGVEFVDSTVVNALFAGAPRIRACGGDLAIVAADTAAARVFEIAGVDVLYRVVANRDQALERLGITPGKTE